MDSDYEYEEIDDFEEEAYEATDLNSEPPPIRNNPDSESFNELNSSIIEEDSSVFTSGSIYNRSEFKLEDNKDSRVYIFRNNLFNRTLLPIKINTEREMEVKCISCNYKLITPVKGFRSSNLARHY
ncbi:hypothetical protein GGI42DRAFT_337879 [Trichoderma sp. SZMC 28013]